MEMAVQSSITMGVAVLFGPVAGLVHLGAAASALFFMAMFDYMMHYGGLHGREGRMHGAIRAHAWGKMHCSIHAGSVGYNIMAIIIPTTSPGLSRPLLNKREITGGTTAILPGTSRATMISSQNAEVDASIATDDRDPNGPCRYAPANQYIAWNSWYPLESRLTFNVLHHSEHHVEAHKRCVWERITKNIKVH